MADDPHSASPPQDAEALRAMEEDQPAPLDPGLPPEIASPLAPFAGAKPPAPAWFDWALAQEPERGFVTVEGARIELLTWGEKGRPGLLFVHGNSAHADWWSFIAPFLADRFRIAAISFSGMGASDWRERYSFPLFAEEMYAAGRAAGLYEAGLPIYVGHSFGGGQVFHSALHHPERMRAALLVDTGFGGPPTEEQLARWRAEEIAAGRTPQRWGGPSMRTGPNKVYATLEQALTRFRFMPPQVPGNLYIADFIARRSLKRVPMADGSGDGWTWRFDPGLWAKLDRSGMEPVAGSFPSVPLAHIFGDRSAIIARHAQMSRDLIPADAPHIVIPDSEHHIMVDQPLALVAALRALLAVWPA